MSERRRARVEGIALGAITMLALVVLLAFVGEAAAHDGSSDPKQIAHIALGIWFAFLPVALGWMLSRPLSLRSPWDVLTIVSVLVIVASLVILL